MSDVLQAVIDSGVFRCLELHTEHEPDGRCVKLLIRKGRKKRKGERQERKNLDVGSSPSGFEPTYNSAVS